MISLLFMLDMLLGKQVCRRYQTYARHSLWISIILLLVAVLLVPVFNRFWMEVFHPLVFDNELWRTNPQDIPGT
ncbi:MAG: DUF1461 domain-containing protein [Thiolinea sp.]